MNGPLKQLVVCAVPAALGLAAAGGVAHAEKIQWTEAVHSQPQAVSGFQAAAWPPAQPAQTSPPAPPADRIFMDISGVRR